MTANEAQVLNRPATAGEVPTHHGGIFWGPTAPESTLLGYADGRQWIRLPSGRITSRRPAASFRDLGAEYSSEALNRLSDSPEATA